MNMTSESTSFNNTTIKTSTVQFANDHNRTLVIILTVALPVLACTALLTLAFICYRRRQTRLWLKKFENSSRLQSFGTNLSSIAIQSQHVEKKRRFSYRQYLQPRTETIIYNQLNPSPSPIVRVSAKGETNAAFEECTSKNEQQPILKTNFPTSVQTPVQTITSAFVEAIATHRLSILTDTNHSSLVPPTSQTTVHNSQNSITSSTPSNTSPTLLLFSQRTQF